MFDAFRNAARYAAAAAAFVLLASCGGSENDTPAAAPLFQTSVVFGASGADNGNRCGFPGDDDPLCFPTPAYASPSTAANGPLYPQLLATRYGGSLTASSAGGFNYAVGGARTGVIPGDTTVHVLPNLQTQADQFLRRVNFQANPQHLYIVDGTTFGNNIRRALTMIGGNPALAATLPAAAVQQGVTDVMNLVTRLYASGARHVVLVNATNMALHPAVAALGPDARLLAGGMSAGYNDALGDQAVPALRASLPGLNLYYVDLRALGREMMENPAAFGLTNVTAPCYPYFSAPQAPICANPSQYMWWDELHPSAAVHAIVAERAAAAIGR